MNREEIVSILVNKGFVATEKVDFMGNSFTQYTIEDDDAYTGADVCINETSIYLLVPPVIDIDDISVSIRIYLDGADGLYLGGMSLILDEIEYFDIE